MSVRTVSLNKTPPVDIYASVSLLVFGWQPSGDMGSTPQLQADNNQIPVRINMIIVVEFQGHTYQQQPLAFVNMSQEF